MKYFEVKLEIQAENKDAIERMLDGMPHADRICEEEIIDPDEDRLEARIRYDEKFTCGGETNEAYVFELKHTTEDEWGLDTAFVLKDDRLSYQALTKIRELGKMGIPFYFC